MTTFQIIQTSCAIVGTICALFAVLVIIRKSGFRFRSYRQRDVNDRIQEMFGDIQDIRSEMIGKHSETRKAIKKLKKQINGGKNISGGKNQ